MADLFDCVMGCISFICVPCLLICARHANKEDPIAPSPPEPVIRTVVIHSRGGSFHSVTMEDSASDPGPVKDDRVRVI